MRSLALWLWLASALQGQEAVFSADVRLVRLAVTVRDESGALVGGLPREAFQVFDSGAAQEVAVFERSSVQPLSVAVLVDASGSTAKDLDEEVVSIRTFLRELISQGNPADVASLYAFNHEVTQLVPFGRRLARFEDALKRIRSEAGTSLYDALQFASQDLMAREGRRAIVVVTDGGDTTSAATLREALQAAHRAEAAVYPILVVPIQNEVGRNTGGENALTIIATRTGGQVQLASLGANLNRAFARILEDLRTQYLLGYYPRELPPARGGFREVRVDVAGEGARKLRAFTRSGYYEESRGATRRSRGPAR